MCPKPPCSTAAKSQADPVPAEKAYCSADVAFVALASVQDPRSGRDRWSVSSRVRSCRPMNDDAPPRQSVTLESRLDAFE